MNNDELIRKICEIIGIDFSKVIVPKIKCSIDDFFNGFNDMLT